MENELPTRPMWYKKNILNGFWLKIVGFIFTLIDHIGLMFLTNGSTLYTIFRDAGRLAMPIFIFLAVEGVYYTKDYWMYFIRLMTMAIILDGTMYIMIYAFKETSLAPGNIFTDLAFGSMAVYFLKKKNWKSLLAIFPIALSVISCFSTYKISNGFQSFINFDYGLFGMMIFIGFFLSYEGAYIYLNGTAKKLNVDPKVYMENGKLRFYINLISTVSLVFVALIFQLIWHYDMYNPIIPSLSLGGMRCESWCVLAGVFIMLYDGRPGFRNKWARYSLYLFYPVHLIILWLITLAL